MDYEELLRKYIEHVRQSEGTDFIDRLNFSASSDVVFTEEEVDALRSASNSESHELDLWPDWATHRLDDGFGGTVYVAPGPMPGQYVELDSESREPIQLFTVNNYVHGSLKKRPQP